MRSLPLLALPLLALPVLALALLLPGCDDASRSPVDGGADRGAAADLPRSDWRGEGPPPGVDGKPPGDGPRSDTSAPPVDRCAPLAAPTGTVIKVTPAQAAQLPGIVAGAASGATVLLGDGTYLMQGGESTRRIQITKPLTLRSASGQRDKVILDGEYVTQEIITSTASDVTIADLTIKRAVYHLVHVMGAPGNTRNTRLYNLALVDSGEQFVKVNSDGQGHYADEGRLECSSLELTAAGRPHIQTNPGGCYTGGIDGHGAWNWVVRDNHFKGIHCENGSLAEHAVHFWTGSRDTLVERNLILDCARGVGFGLGDSGTGRDYPDKPYPGVGYLGHVDGIIRNNLIHASGAAAQWFDTGIELAQARGVKVLHNTVASKPTFSSIDYRWANTVATIRNNLTSKITQRDGAAGTVDHNLESAATTLFVNAANADYHLAAGAAAAIDKGVAVPEAGLDLDGKAHDVGLPDLGAYERRP